MNRENTITKEEKIRCIVIGALAGVLIGGWVFFVPDAWVEEGIRLTLAVIAILIAPRAFNDWFHLPFTTSRWGMAGGIVLTVVTFILSGRGTIG